MKILLQAIKSLIRKLENCFREDGVIKQTSLPDGYPYAYMGTVTVLPETTLTDRTDSFWGLDYRLDLMDNATYTVDWNGTRYSCVAYRLAFFGYDSICLGSVSSTDELRLPFAIVTLTTANDTIFSSTMIVPYDDSTTVTIAITGPKITKINAAYIPRLDATNIQNGEGAWSICSMNAVDDTGKCSIAFGDEADASGNNSCALGCMNRAYGSCSFAAGGIATTANGNDSVAFSGATANGNDSVAFSGAIADGDYSVAIGDATASGDYSVAIGAGVAAAGDHQFVYGKYNIEDTENKYSHIVGNGDSSNRSNAHTLDWDGNAWYQGCIKVGGTGWDDATDEVALKSDLEGLGGSGASNLFNGSAVGSLRSVGATAEDDNYTIGEYAVALGNGTTASGANSHAEGKDTTASGLCSHAEGNGTTASGVYSHTEGDSTLASGRTSHAEGSYTRAIGVYSHSEGVNSIAKGPQSHAEGYGTIAAGENQHAQGKHNIEDTENKYIHIVGNGDSSSNRSNAHTLDWDGNAWFAGTMEGTAVILKSSTEGSTKRFKVTVDDAGTLSAVEINS